MNYKPVIAQLILLFL